MFEERRKINKLFLLYLCTHKHYLVQHNRFNSGEKPFACDVYNKALSPRQSLVRHKRVHTEEESNPSDISDKKFTYCSSS